MSQKSIIFLPGFMCDGRLFSAQITSLRRLGYATALGDITNSASIESLAQDILHNAPDHFALVGLSMGGIVALEIMRQAPERVSHLALLNTTPYADKSQEQRKVQLLRVAEGELDLVMQEELKPQYLAVANRTRDRLNLLASMARELGEEVFARQSIALMARDNYQGILSQIDCPTLVLTGRNDRVCTPEIHDELAQAIPDATLQIVARCGHLSAMEQPDIVNSALINLLKQQRKTSQEQEKKGWLRLVSNQ